jgi:poly-gamma-glutamate capsule biosynthesis protein CapA/YwtB (metallophosphatase superfamily)
VTEFFSSFLALFITLVPIHGRPVRAITAPPRPPVQAATILFGGDMMFDRYIRLTTERNDNEYVLSCMRPLFEKADLVVANLEGPITTSPSKSLGSIVGSPDNFTFTFATSTAPMLYKHNIRLVNLGNNHIENFGLAGVHSTLEELSKAEVDYFGDPLSSTVARKVIGNVRLAFINYNQFITPIHGSSASTTVAQIREARKDGYVPIVYTHWGTEYATTSSPRLYTLAHQFIDAGAEVVIGSHPHVVAEHEIYKDKHIYYSLGNLVFDQYWTHEVRRGLVIDVRFDGHGVSVVKEIPVNIYQSGITCPDSTPPGGKILPLD